MDNIFFKFTINNTILNNDILYTIFASRGSKSLVIVNNIIKLGKTIDCRMHKRTASATTHAHIL